MQKIIIASDIHGSARWCAELLSAFENEGADKLILLGDLLYHGPRNDFPDDYSPRKVFAMLNSIKDKLTCVRGNCDSEVDQMVLEFPILADYALLSVNGRTLFLTHGHLYPWLYLALLEFLSQFVRRIPQPYRAWKLPRDVLRLLFPKRSIFPP